MKNLLASIGVAFERLSSREQRFVLLMITLVVCFVVGLSGFLVKRDFNRREARIEAKTERLVELGALKVDYQRRLGEQNRLATEIRGNNPLRLLSYIEEVSKHANIELGNAQDRAGEATGSELLKEEGAEVTIRNVSIDRLYDFLKRLEEGNHLIKVRHLKIRRRFDNPKKLDATVTVGTFKTTS